MALDRHWIVRSRDRDGLALLTPVLERPDARTDPLLFGKALNVAAISSRISDVASARRYGEQAVELARQLDNGRLLIAALAVLSSALLLRRRGRARPAARPGSRRAGPAAGR